MGDVLDLLKASPPLAALSPAELQAVAKASHQVICDPGRPFFARADASGQR